MSFGALLLLLACAPRGEFSFDDRIVSSQQVVQPVFVATNRQRVTEADSGFFRQKFGDKRDSELRFARVDISIPPVHQAGRIEWPAGAVPNPRIHFVAQKEQIFKGPATFVQNINSQKSSKETLNLFSAVRSESRSAVSICSSSNSGWP